MKIQSYVLTNEENKIMAIIQAENSKILKEKALKAISEDYDLENVHLLKSDKIDFDYVLTPKDKDSLYNYFVDKFGDYLVKYYKNKCA